MASDETSVPLQVHIDQRLEDLSTLIDSRFDALGDRFTSLSTMVDDVHRDISHVNDRLPSFMTRSDYESRHASVLEAQSNTDRRLSRLEGINQSSADMIARVIALIAALSAIASLVVLIITKG